MTGRDRSLDSGASLRQLMHQCDLRVKSLESWSKKALVVVKRGSNKKQMKLVRMQPYIPSPFWILHCCCFFSILFLRAVGGHFTLLLCVLSHGVPPSDQEGIGGNEARYG